MRPDAMRQPFRLMLMAALLGLFLTGCVAMDMPQAEEEMETMAPDPGKITVVGAMSRPSPMAAGNGAAYMTILNGLDVDVQLTSAATDIAEAVELHETVNDDGVMRMVPQPDGFTVPAGGRVELKPGGKHVMMIGLVEPLEPGDEIELTLTFDNGDFMTLSVPVTEMSGEMPAGMDHGEMESGEEESSEGGGD